ncbi:hypothetical protein RN001_013690 [Aquatica leii]|uniref:VPS9 domain-containing protein n=1 Tax=Aquatica leii TaxID=1421715 RepID=A0AAN7NWL2_9COLE|nr:hypothetical protein RN001_013690 [Aquatica leii]
MNFYDECLEENEFFLIIQENHNDIIKKATEENWIICIPRVGSLNSNVITDEDILENVLVPNTELPVTHFCTLSKREVCIQDKSIIVNNDYVVNILFDETFYINKHEKYKVWCIDRPLHKQFTVAECDFDYSIVRNVHDCIKLLWTKDRTVLKKINRLIESYLEKSFEFENLTILKKQIGELYEQSVSATKKEAYVSLAVETYIQHCVHLKLFRAICNFTASTDSCFNKILRNLSDIQFKDLDINVVFAECISSSKFQLSHFNKVVTVLGKVECLRRIVNIISSQKNLCVTTDDLLKIFVFLVIKSNINNWIANLTYIMHFRFSAINLKDEYAFLITTLEAAIEYIKSGDIKVYLRFDNDYLSTSFTQVEIGDLQTVKKVFEEKCVEKVSNKKMLMCHPLCICDKCALHVVDVNSCNEKGWTALHVACIYGHPHLVEYFLSKNAIVNVCDDLAMTPLHYAALKGHQNALLLLLHASADTNLKDSNGNTALHLATNNGHESCVKAILYFNEQKGVYLNVNVTNNVGDTPLHLSVKWGYAGITKILIQYGGDPNATNKWNHTVFDTTHNDYIKNLLVAKDIPKLEVGLTQELNKISPSVAENLEQFKKIDLILKSIENNDLPLMCYYLGIPTPAITSTMVNAKLICHPLCTCDSCQEEFENSSVMPSATTEPVNINVSNSEGYTPLHTAAKHGRLNILRLLLDQGALVNIASSKEQLTPLHLACKHQRIKIVRELLQCGGCNIDVQDAKGNTPLHYACLSNDYSIVELLLLNNCDSSIKNASGKTALQEAHSMMYWNILKLFKIKYNNNNDTQTSFEFFSV